MKNNLFLSEKHSNQFVSDWILYCYVVSKAPKVRHFLNEYDSF